MYLGHNENKHLVIMKKLLELGADPNAHDIYGFTPLQFSLRHICGNLREPLAAVLLKHGADPNPMCCFGHMPLNLCLPFNTEEYVSMYQGCVDLLIRYNAKPKSKEDSIHIITQLS